MRYSQLFMMLDETGLSPEQAAKRLGVSNMTLRRWRTQPGDTELAPKYARAFKPVFAAFASEGLFGKNSPAGRSAADDQKHSFQTVLKNLGFPENFLETGLQDRRGMILGLSKVGADELRKSEVERSKKKITLFGRMGKEWKERTGGLLAVIRSKELLAKDKFVAYGALFYLLMPFDLIPDAIPMIGLIDDFTVLGIALWFYRKQYPEMFKKS